MTAMPSGRPNSRITTAFNVVSIFSAGYGRLRIRPKATAGVLSDGGLGPPDTGVKSLHLGR
ncbi:hypothetical protein GCM10010206_17500 [Streptomyces cinerochromogenes]|nr:hypothetical protein GCM10010206_17500 [Streptomyces cinerochromogenes]